MSAAASPMTNWQLRYNKHTHRLNDGKQHSDNKDAYIVVITGCDGGINLLENNSLSQLHL